MVVLGLPLPFHGDISLIVVGQLIVVSPILAIGSQGERVRRQQVLVAVPDVAGRVEGRRGVLPCVPRPSTVTS